MGILQFRSSCPVAKTVKGSLPIAENPSLRSYYAGLHCTMVATKTKNNFKEDPTATKLHNSVNLEAIAFIIRVVSGPGFTFVVFVLIALLKACLISPCYFTSY